MKTISERCGVAALSLGLVGGAFMLGLEVAQADEGGVSFWLPGTYESLAATPQVPGWALASIYYHTDVSAAGAAAPAREGTIRRLNLTVSQSKRQSQHARTWR